MSDPRQLSIDGAEAHDDLSVRAWVRAHEKALARVMSPHSANTHAAYQAAWDRWAEHARARQLPLAPIAPAELVVYLEHLSTTAAPNTVRLHLAALCSLDSASRVTPTNAAPLTLRASVVVKRWLKSWAREHPRAPQHRAPALTVAQLTRVLEVAAERHGNAPRNAHVLRYARDRCLVLWGVTGGLRVSELVALTLDDVSTSERGVTLRIRASKTDQDGSGATVGLMAQGRTQLCPVDAWLQWRAVRGETPGPVFCGLSRDGALSPSLSRRQVTQRLHDLSERAGIELVSAHSMRATFATLASARGKSMASIANQGRWKSLDQVREYVRQGTLWVDNPSSGLLDD